MMAQRTILLTGASGVVGAALVPRLSRHRVISLAHRNPPGAGEVVTGDLRMPGLGLDSRTRRDLADRVDVVVHCAATTDFGAGTVATRELNVDGTAHVLRFAADAGAVVHYVSTAFVARAELSRAEVGEATADPQTYLESKRAAENLVRRSGIPATIVRPSVVIGDTATGRIVKFQALYLLAAAVVRNRLPLLPLRPADRVDIVPQDVLAGAIAALVEADVRGAEHWITAGHAALTAGRVVDLVVEAGTRAGRTVRPPRLVDPEMVDRLVRPAFFGDLPPVTRRRFDDLLAMTALAASDTTLPTTLGEVPGCVSLDEARLASAFGRSLGYFLDAMGWVRSRKSAA